MIKNKKYVLGIATLLALTSCTKENRNSENPIVGTWKIYEKYEDENLVMLSECEAKESLNFGETQYSHETYLPKNNSLQGKQILEDDVYWAYKGDDDHHHEKDDDHHHGKDDDHHHGKDDDHHHGKDDDHHGKDDDYNGGGNGDDVTNCETATITVGHWEKTTDGYKLTPSNGAVQTLAIHFQKNNTEFFFEKTKPVHGSMKTVRYIFKKQ